MLNIKCQFTNNCYR